MAEGKAYVFINYDQAVGFGHIGWGFHIAGDTYYYGSTDHLWNTKYALWDPVELIKYMNVNPSGNNDYWSAQGTEEQMLQTMRLGRHVRYHSYKVVTTPKASPLLARAYADSMRENGWNVLLNNCVHQSYQILTKYGGKDILPCPYKLINRFPRKWFDSIPAEARQLEKPTGRIMLPFFTPTSNRRVS